MLELGIEQGFGSFDQLVRDGSFVYERISTRFSKRILKVSILMYREDEDFG
jgi:hypothetical protein